MKKLKLFFKNLNKKKKKTKVEDTLKIKKDKLAKSTKNEVKNTIISSIVIFVISIVLLVGIFGLIYLKMIIDDAPTFNVSDLTNYESSKIYDINGELVADVGSVMRENVSYDEMPQAFIDAFIATEDSRFFVHNGFDLPRFTKSVLENLKTLSFSQGASTISMQLMRNVYFTDDASGVNRVKSLSYKIQQIYLAIKCEQVLSKKTIFEYYVNRINYGASSTRGVKGAAQYYFGKDVNELDLSECAYLAGVINAPNANNAYKHYDAAVKRRNNVLYLMNLHGYISDEEYELAKSIELADQLVGANVANSAYQAYVNEVVDECLELTGKDPYISALNIYTYMDRNLQERIEGIERGEITSFSWPDDYVQCGIVTMDNSTGAILAIGGGRDSIVPKGYSRVSDMKRQPGSSVKPFLSYALAFEYLGYATSYTVEDIPVVYKGTSIEIHNADEIYHGDLLLKDAIGKSYNIPAYKTLEKLADTLGSSTIIEYLNSLGFNQVNRNNFDLGYSIGGSTFEVTVEQMAAAHSAMINGGYSVVPHTIQRIEFNDGSEPYEPEYPSVSVISEASAYLSTYCMENDVSGHYGNYMDILDNNNYEVYAKTGTSNHDDSFIELGIPAGVAKDRWMIASTSEITTAVWLGYDSVVDGNCYFDGPKSWINMPGKINKEILNTYYSYHPYPKNVEKPESVQSITHLKGVYPYAAVDETTPEELVVTGLINKKFNTLEETPEITIETLKNVNVVESSVDGNKLTVTVKFDRYPTNYELQEDGTFLYTLEYERKPEEGETPEEGKDTITVYRKVNLNKFYDPQLIKGPIRYVVALNDEIIATSDKNEFTFEYDINYSIKDVTFSCYYKYRDDEMTSNFDEITIDLSNYSFEVNISSLNTIAKVSSLMNQLDLNWTLESIPLTKTAVDNGHSSGEVISIKGSDYSKDLREETITEKLSDIKNVVVQYYNEISISFDSDYSTLLDTYELYKQYLNNITIVYVPTLDVEQNHKIVSISNEIPEDTSIYELTTLGNIEITVYQYTE